MKKFKRYIPVKKPMKPSISEALEDTLIFLHKEEQKVPYYEVEIRVIGYERNYVHNRPTPILARRLLKAFKEAVKIFKRELK